MMKARIHSLSAPWQTHQEERGEEGKNTPSPPAPTCSLLLPSNPSFSHRKEGRKELQQEKDPSSLSFQPLVQLLQQGGCVTGSRRTEIRLLQSVGEEDRSPDLLDSFTFRLAYIPMHEYLYLRTFPFLRLSVVDSSESGEEDG